ncbi:hypothetical protein HOK96_02065 [bacterium]|jgi:hypothetical protein|nr:hypothetical protein [bacterium]MBT5345818.1 hypothetical protein [bacterium]MBT6131294.1 hypothetical protein [bacterium]
MRPQPIKELLDRCENNQLPPGSIVVFCSETYQPRFVRFILDCLQERSGAWNSIVNKTYQDMLAALSSSFLGQGCQYWLGSGVGMPKPKRSSLLNFLRDYSGPHTVAVWVSSAEASILESSDNVVMVRLPAIVDESTFQMLANSSLRTRTNGKRFVKNLIKRRKRLTLDQASLLLAYQPLLGASIDQFCTVMLDRIVAPNHSLFALSKALFERDRITFYKEWGQVRRAYPAIFWVSFFARQLLRALLYLNHAKDDLKVAKRCSSRLPFSFVNGGWKAFNTKELAGALGFVYDVDCSLKNGGSDLGLELFAAKFFDRAFFA